MDHRLFRIFVYLIAAAAFAQTPCEQLKSLPLAHATITAAESRTEGPKLNNAPAVPPHCRVAAVLTPSSDSHIEMELWMPASGWNGKFQAVGNGGGFGVATATPPRLAS